uniref:tRNA-dihydrouridine(47) synthase [NAD(P)(+)] n=1 Tax=Ciona intestinalis TaxID=7719 RepID=Q1RLG4_CIOIN|nr:zinc finger protein ZF(C3H)-5 [Ciona intestinalis]FAA00101.1 TPA: zinc finger protein [Ciona intestinalis]|eukprot:NP_001123329.1 zinc finger protein ZF(C3H)-5 [Ciona intestinalis]
MTEGRYVSFISSASDGTAQIKKEFVTSKPTLVEQTVKPLAEETKEETSADSEIKSSNGDRERKKPRGQNKNRPRPKQEQLSLKLCPSKISEKGYCHFGEKCQYLHDIGKYMELKPDDLGEKCFAFQTIGKCNYSFTCRFARDHVEKTNEGYVNKVDEEKLKTNSVKIKNVLPRDLQLQLRKRKFDFSKSDTAVKESSKAKARKLDQNAKKIPENVGNEENVTTVVTTGDITTSEDVLNKHGCVLDTDLIPLKTIEKKTIDFRDKLYLAPLTTCGNLPFRVVCKRLGADITCGEMAVATNVLQAKGGEWALMKRHPCEDIFGVQLCGAFPDTMSRCAELISKTCEVDFIDINMGCPIDLIYKKGAGSALMRRTNKLFDIVNCMNRSIDVPLTCKVRAGVETKKNCAHNILPKLRDYGVAMTTVHGRSREARYTKAADWGYISECAALADPMPVFGNGDILSYHDYMSVMENTTVSGVMIARGALIKPWVFTEIKERRDWDISSGERLDILRQFVNEGFVHWGSDTRGVENTRRFLLEWLSFLHRYIPVGLLERLPQRINERPPYYVGRNDLETLMGSANSNDWVKISEMLLGKVPDSFQFLPKHKANSYK